jgi:NAD(P)-dependent dehydrogenase (short-subunit alcohol dehydrogenase family)
MVKPTVLVTGANRGIGLEFVRQYAADGWTVLATARDVKAATDLAAIPGSVEIFELEATSDASMAALAARLGARPIDVLIPNAGGGGGPPVRVEELDRNNWREALALNTYGPFHLAALLRSNLEAGTQRKLVGISSGAASIGIFEQNGYYAYRAAKAALNSLWRTLSVEWKPLGITCMVLRPGRVRTRQTEFNGDLSAEQSVGGMRKVIARVGIEETGCFYGYDGQEVPW